MVRQANVLLVEDDPTCRRLFAMILAEMGCTVITAASGEEALSMLYSEDSCDLVLTDVVMPGMSGIELAKRAHDARPGLPVVLVTGQPDGAQAATDAGALALPKPIARERLATLLGDALGPRWDAMRQDRSR